MIVKINKIERKLRDFIKIKLKSLIIELPHKAILPGYLKQPFFHPI